MNRFKITRKQIDSVVKGDAEPNWYKRNKDNIETRGKALYFNDRLIVPVEDIDEVLRKEFYDKKSTTPWARDSGYADISKRFAGISKRAFAGFAQRQRVKIMTDNVPKRVERKGNRVNRKGQIEMDLYQISKKDLPTNIKGKMRATIKANPQGFVLTMVDKLTSLTYLHFVGFPRYDGHKVKDRKTVEPAMNTGIKWFEDKLGIPKKDMWFIRDGGGEFPPVSQLRGLVIKLGPAVEARNSFAQRVMHRLLRAKRGTVAECVKQAQEILNNTKSRISKKTPNEAAQAMVGELSKSYNAKRSSGKVRAEKPLKVGDRVRLMTKSKKENMYKAYKGKQWSTEKYEIVEVSKRKPYRYKLKMGEKKRVWRYRDQISNAEGPTDTKSEALLAGLTATGKVKAVPKPKAKKPKKKEPAAPAPLRRSGRARKSKYTSLKGMQ